MAMRRTAFRCQSLNANPDPTPNPTPDPTPDPHPDPNPDPNQVPKCLKGRKWHDHGAILAGEDNTEPSGNWPGAHAEEP